MIQGKIMNVTQLRTICSELFLGKSQRTIAKDLHISRSTLLKFLGALKNNSIASIQELNSISDSQLVQIIYGNKADIGDTPREKNKIIKHRDIPPKAEDIYTPDMEPYLKLYVEAHLHKADIYVDYLKAANEKGLKPLGETSFRRRLNKIILENTEPNVDMHREHEYGNELELDWCGQQFEILDNNKNTVSCNVLVLCWATSYFTYARLVPSLSTVDTIDGIRDGLMYFGCLPRQLLIDNPKSMVIKHHIGSEAIFTPGFDKFMRKCGVAVNPNNPYSPNEKSAVETSVRLIQDRCLSRMPKGCMFLDDANITLMKNVNEYINSAPFKREKFSPRKVLFERYEKPAAKPIEMVIPPFTDYIPSLIVRKDYHVEIYDNFYSVPYKYVNKVVEAEISGGIIQIWLNQKIIAQHVKINGVFGRYFTKDEHMPMAHKVVKEKELMYKTPDDIYNAARALSNDLLNFCIALLSRSDNFADNKKGCINLINKYKRNPQEQHIYNCAIQSILHDPLQRPLNSYVFADAVKEISQYADNHHGQLPFQTELSFDTPDNSVGNQESTAFLRTTDDLFRNNK